MDIRQSHQYAQYLKLLGWQVEKINGCQIFIRRFPLVGSVIKIQRPEKIPSSEKIYALVKKYRAFQILIEPKEKLRNLEIKKFRNLGFCPSSPSLPSKTLYIDLTRSEDQIFANFSSSKRRDIRKAIRDNVVVKEAEDIEGLIKMKNIQNGISGRILKVDKQFKALWQVFRPHKATLLLAYSPDLPDFPDYPDALIPLAGLLLLFHNQVAYYYQAASNKRGNKLAASSLLVWQALKLAKKRGCKIFDFEGIYDPRFPQKSWLGFTKFKKGFGGRGINYPSSLVKNFLLCGPRG